MEYTAALEGLRSLPAGSRACVVTDSRLMLDSMTKWIHGWKRKGWKTAGGDPVKNQDLVRALDAEIARHELVRWHWVRGHETGAQHAHKAFNDRADRLAVAASHAGVAPPGANAAGGGWRRPRSRRRDDCGLGLAPHIVRGGATRGPSRPAPLPTQPRDEPGSAGPRPRSAAPPRRRTSTAR